MTQVTNYEAPADLTGLNTRVAINATLLALRDANAGNTAPPNPVAGMLWRDTSASPHVMRIRNSTNTAWIALLADMGVVLGTAAGNIPVLNADAQVPASARGVSIGASSALATLTALDVTGIPAWANEITVQIRGVVRSTTANPLLQVGNGTIVTTGYAATAGLFYGATAATAAYTTGFGVYNGLASDSLGGVIVLRRFESGSNRWIATGQFFASTGVAIQSASIQGEINLGGALDRLRFSGNGATFSAGSMSVSWRA